VLCQRIPPGEPRAIDPHPRFNHSRCGIAIWRFGKEYTSVSVLKTLLKINTRSVVLFLQFLSNPVHCCRRTLRSFNYRQHSLPCNWETNASSIPHASSKVFNSAQQNNRMHKSSFIEPFPFPLLISVQVFEIVHVSFGFRIQKANSPVAQVVNK